jgi:energy-coupling factor transport system ATP-binding protein
MEDMALLCDKILVLNEGAVYDFGPTEDIFSKAEELRKIGLNVPMISAVFSKLREKYKIQADNIITVDGAFDFLNAYLS